MRGIYNIESFSLKLVTYMQGRKEEGKGGTIPRAWNHYGGAE